MTAALARLVAVLALVPPFIAKVVQLSGAVDTETGAWLSGMILLLLLPIVITGFLRQQLGVSNGTKAIYLVVYAVLVYSLLSPAWNASHRAAPYTSQALAERAKDSDIRTADAVRPVGTQHRQLLARERKWMEDEIAVREDERLQKARMEYHRKRNADPSKDDQFLLELVADSAKIKQDKEVQLNALNILFPKLDEEKAGEEEDAGGWLKGIFSQSGANLRALVPSVPFGVWATIVILVSLFIVFGTAILAGKYIRWWFVSAPVIIFILGIGLGTFVPWMFSLIDDRVPIATKRTADYRDRGTGGQTGMAAVEPSVYREDFQQNLALAEHWLSQHPRVPREIFLALIRQESDWNPRAVSIKEAKGLGQLMSGTAARFGVRDVFDPSENLRGSIEYFDYLLGLSPSTEVAIAAYNMGEGDLQRQGIVSWAQIAADAPKETREFVNSVLARAQALATGGTVRNFTALAAARPSTESVLKAITLPPNLRSLPVEDQRKTVILVSTSRTTPIHVSWFDYEGKEQCFTCPNGISNAFGQLRLEDAAQGEVLVIRDKATNSPIDVIRPNGQPEMSYVVK